jgi:phosphate transport system permease protein
MDNSQDSLHLKTGGIRRRREALYRWVLFACTVLTVLATLGIILVLVTNAAEFFSEYSVWDFATGTRWSPTISPTEFGVLPLVSGTLIITIGSALIALPIGVATAVYLSEFASRRVRSIVKPFLEILAGIPTVVYGYFALVYITPVLQKLLPEVSTFNALSGSIVVGVMIIPFVSSISEDAMSSVPDSLREAAYGMGATKFEVTIRVVIPAALSGIVASFILAFSRAIGETMAVTIAAGQSPRMIDPSNLEASLLKPIETMTAAMVNLGMSDVTGDSLAYQSLFAVGLALFCITFVMNILGAYVSSRYKEKYE